MPSPNNPKPNGATLRLAADIGGTFTDIAVFDDTTGALTFGKALSTPQHLVDGINAGVEKAGSDYALGRPVPARLDHRHQHDPRAHRRQDRAAHHRGLSRHLRDRPHQPARRLQSVLPEARAAGRARAALRGEGARARRRRGRHAARRGRDRGARRASSKQLGIEAAAILFLNCYAQRRPRGARQGDPRDATSRACSSPPRTSCRRNIASSSAARPWWPTPISARRCAATSARSTSTSAAPASRLVPDRAVDRRPLRGRAGAEPVRAHAGVGPAAGVIGTQALCHTLGLDNAIAFDMGGTTAKAGVIYQRRGAHHRRGADRRLRQGAAGADRHDGHFRGRHRRRLDRARRGGRRCASARRARAPRPGPPATASAAPSRP